MATDNLEEGVEVTPEAFEDLQKRLAKAEKKLAKAKSRAQATMQEIWQLDVKLKEEEERANQAEARLAEVQGDSDVPPSNDAAEASAELAAEIESLRAELEHARESASEVEDLKEQVSQLLVQVEDLKSQLELKPSEAEVDDSQITELQERVVQLEEEKESLQVDLQVKIVELENALALAEEGQAGEEPLPDPETSAALEEARSTIADLEAQLAERPNESIPSAAVAGGDDELWEARLSGLRLALHEAEERARIAEDNISRVGGSTSAFEEQLESIQQKVREAEERALEWEEKFHKSEERAVTAEAAVADGSSDTVVAGLQARVDELVSELEAERASGGEEADTSELEEMRVELMEAQDRISELEGLSGVNADDFQRLEDEVEELQKELESANQRVDKAEKRADLAENVEGDELLSQFKERLELADQRNELLNQKADQAREKLEMAQSQLAELKEEREQLNQEMAKAKEKIAELNERLEKESGQAQAIGLSGAAVESQLQDALQRARDAELKANQAEVQLTKAMDTLQEYEMRANESDRETQRLAFQDSLTGLPNLNLIRQYLEFTVKQVQRYNRASALLVVDLDRFKLINDAMGFKAGDELLAKVAERLQTAIRESDALGRKGEDEFLILLSELITGDDTVAPEQKTNMIRQNIAIVVNRISECLSRPFHIQGQKFYIRASIGVSICPNDADSAQAMLEHADSAMYHAKESGRGRCVFYNNELHKRQERRLTMDSQLRLAMEKGEFVLQYQPIIEMTKGKGQIVGVEALLRWNHRIDGLLAPSAFLNIAEETGLIVQLGQWVCRQACWQLRQWLSQGHNLFVSFNVSTRQMLQADLGEMILSSVEEFGLQPGLVFVELSEGTNVEEVDLIERVVASLGRSGVRVAIDDFGIGYSSLSRIDLNHIQFLKVDPSLINGCQQDRAKANICEAAVRLAQSLELRALAEGVETLAQAKFLSKIGCQFLQGFHIQEPADASVITKLLEEKKAWKF